MKFRRKRNVGFAVLARLFRAEDFSQFTRIMTDVCNTPEEAIAAAEKLGIDMKHGMTVAKIKWTSWEEKRNTE